MTNTQPRRRLPYLLRVVLVLGAVVAALVVAGRMGIVGNGPASTATPRPAAPVTETVPAGSIGDGVWIVGSDVQPGTYRSTGATNDRYCMWSRHSSTAGGPMDSIIASDGSYAGQMLVTIEAGDNLFRTRGCDPFAKV